MNPAMENAQTRYHDPHTILAVVEYSQTPEKPTKTPTTLSENESYTSLLLEKCLEYRWRNKSNIKNQASNITSQKPPPTTLQKSHTRFRYW